MNTTTSHKKNGYTLVEVLMAAALLGVMVGAAVQLVGTMNTVETSASNNTVAYDMVESAARLWQLGLATSEALAVLPITTNNDILDRCVIADNNGNTVSFGTETGVTPSGTIITVRSIPVSVVTRSAQGSTNLTTTVTAYRPTTR